MGKLKIAATILCLVSISGCSYLFMEQLPKDHRPSEAPKCTSTSGFVLWDSALGVADTVGALYGLSAAGSDDPDVARAGMTLLLLSGLLAITHFSVASTGAGWYRQCRKADKRFRKRKRQPHQGPVGRASRTTTTDPKHTVEDTEYRPVRIEPPGTHGEIYSRVLSGVVARGWDVAVNDRAGGLVTTKFEKRRDGRRYRWAIHISPARAVRIESQCMRRAATKCRLQPAERGAQAKGLARELLLMK